MLIVFGGFLLYTNFQIMIYNARIFTADADEKKALADWMLFVR